MALVGLDWFSEVICKWNTLGRGRAEQSRWLRDSTGTLRRVVENMGIVERVKTLCHFPHSWTIIASEEIGLNCFSISILSEISSYKPVFLPLFKPQTSWRLFCCSQLYSSMSGSAGKNTKWLPYREASTARTAALSSSPQHSFLHLLHGAEKQHFSCIFHTLVLLTAIFVIDNSVVTLQLITPSLHIHTHTHTHTPS